ncbi:MAG: GAF domain-containing protein [Candidatus Omnitrophica bacterium]|nr:GAF domain-containing protein [Candidatus Omnitrophota bacterium]
MALIFCAYTGLLNAVTSFALVAFVALKKQKTFLDKKFSFFAFSVGYWSLSYFFWLSADQSDYALFFIRNAMAGAIFIPAAFMHLVLSLTEVPWRSRKKIIVGNYLISTAFLLFCFSPFYIDRVEPRLFFPFWPVPGVLFHFMLLHFSANIVWAHILMWGAMKRTSGLKLNQIKYVFIGTLVGFIGGCTNYLLWYGIPVPPFFNFLVTLYIITLAYAVIKFRLMDINVAMTRTTLFILLYAVVFGVPLAILTWGKPWLRGYWGEHWWYFPLMFYVVLSAAGPFIYMVLRRKAEEVLLKEQRAYQQTLLQASKGMTLIKDLEKLLKLMAHILTKTIRITHASIFLWDGESEQFVCKAARGDHRRQGTDFVAADAALIRQLRETRDPLIFEEVRAGDPSSVKLPDGAIREMEALDAAVIVPSFVQDRLLGFLVLGDKRSKRPYTESDFDTLTTLANQAALAVENCIFLTSFEEQQAHLFQAAKMADLGTMASGIGHQVNNRFNITKLGSEVLMMSSIPRLKKYLKEGNAEGVDGVMKDMEKALKTINDNAAHGGEIVARLLDFSRLSEGFKPVDVKEAVENCIRLWECKHDLTKIDFKLEIADGVPKVYGNLSEIEEILFNLLDNAYDAFRMKEEAWELGHLERPPVALKSAVRLSVSETVRRNKRYVSFQIADNGLGMSEKVQQQLFVPFFTTKATAVKGTGLGLYIIRRMVDAHHGEIFMESEYGKGTTFRVLIPVSEG